MDNFRAIWNAISAKIVSGHRYILAQVSWAWRLTRTHTLSFYSLHDRRFMSQAGRTRYFARSATRARSARRGEEKNKAPVRSPLFLLFRHLRPQIFNYPRWCQKNHSKHDHYRAKIVTFLARSVYVAVEMRSYDCFFHGFANLRA